MSRQKIRFDQIAVPGDPKDGDSLVFDKALGVWMPKAAVGTTLSGTVLPDPAVHAHRLFVLLDAASAGPSGGYAGDPPPQTGNTTPSGSAADYNREVMADSPLFYLPMADASYSDTSGNSRAFTADGGVTLDGPALLASGEGRSAKFAGGWLSSPYASWMNTGSSPTLPGSFVFTAIIRPDAVDGLRCIASRDGTSSSSRGWGFYIEDGKLIVDDGTGRFDGRAVANFGRPLVEAGKTYHVGLLNTGNQALFFLNGVDVSGGTQSLAYFNNSNPFLIGASYRGTSTPTAKFVGLIARPAFLASVYTMFHIRYQAQAAGLAA